MQAQRITAKRKIPTSAYYVTCRSLKDPSSLYNNGWRSFMHGPIGGKWDKDKDNIWIMLCDSKKEADTVFYNASNRADQDSAEIHSAKPQLKKDSAVYTLINRKDAFWWYQTNWSN